MESVEKMGDIEFVEKMKGFLLKPVDTFQKVKEETLSESLKYFLVLILMYSALSAVVITAMRHTIWGSTLFSIYKSLPVVGPIFESGSGTTTALTFFVIFLVGGFIGIFIGAAIVHLGVLLFGGKKGYTHTVNALIYGSTPSYVFGWIPFVMLIIWIWSFILEILGIRELQEMSTGKAVAAVLVPIVIVMIVVMVVLVGATTCFYVSGELGP